MRKLIVDIKNNNKKLSDYLLDTFNGLTISLFYKTLKKKDIRVNNIKVTKNIELHAGDEVSIYLTDNYLFKNFNNNNNNDNNKNDLDNNTKKIDISKSIIYEDDNILVINKPQGISVTESKLKETTLTDVLKSIYGNNINPCHRLDRNTAGLIVYAKNDESLNILLEKFKNKEIRKKYICDVYGILNKKSGTLKSYLFKDNKKSTVLVSDVKKNGYSEIITKYKVINENLNDNYSTLEVEIITGKTHQIRAHLSHIGHPIIGDGKYGLNTINKKFKEKYQRLCSYEITFCFKSDSGILNYLNGKTIKIKQSKIK